MSDTVFVDFQFVYAPGHFKGTGDDIPKPAEYLYLVVYGVLLDESSPSLNAYFSQADTAGTFTYASLAERGNITLGENDCLVPLPPNLAIAWEFDDESPSLNPRRMGGEDAFKVSRDQWLEIVRANRLRLYKFMNSEAETWFWPGSDTRRLSKEQRETLIRWEIDALYRIFKDPPEVPNPFEASMISQLQVAYDAETNGKPEEGLSQARWRDFLNEPSPVVNPAWPTREAWILFEARRLTREFAALSKEMTFPIFQYTYRELEARPEIFDEVFDGAATDTYLEAVWNGYKARLASGVSPADVRKELFRVLTFGERVLWPQSIAPDDKDVMRLPGDRKLDSTSALLDEVPLTWINNRSLCELVYGVPMVDAAKLHITEVTCDGQPLRGFDAAQFKANYNRYFDTVTNLPDGQPFQFIPRIDWDSEDEIGLIKFEPKRTLLDPPEAYPANLDRKVLVVPTTLLDVLEKQGNVNMPPATKQTGDHPRLLYPTPQRVTVHVDELLDDIKQRELYDTYGRVRVNARMTRFPLPGHKIDLEALDARHLFSLQLDANIEEPTQPLDEDELKALRRIIADAINDPDGHPIRLWFVDEPDDPRNDDTMMEIAKIPKEAIVPLPEFIALPAVYDGTQEVEQADGFGLYISEPNGGLEHLLQWFVSQEKAAHQENAGVESLRKGQAFSVSVEMILNPPRPSAAGVFDERQRFNLLLNEGGEFDQDGALLMLRKFYDFQFYQSTEHWCTRFSLGYQYPVASTGAYGRSFEDYKKLWVWLRNEDDVEIRLTENDHVLPSDDAARPKDGSPTTYQPGLGEPRYRTTFAHEFSTMAKLEEDPDLRLNRGISARDDLESDRYLIHRYAGRPWTARLAVDNQFGFRFPADITNAVRLPLLTPVQQLGDRSASVQKIVEVEGENQREGREVHQAVVEITDDGDGETLRINMRSLFFKSVLDPSVASPDNDTGSTRGTPDYERLREVYETLNDLVQNSGGGAAIHLNLERWNFDNTLREIAPEAAAGEGEAFRYPSLLRSMRYLETWRLDLTPRESAPSAVQDWLRALRRLLGNSFESFLQALEDQSADDLELPFKLDRETGWKIVEDPESPLPDINLGKTTNIVRVGLHVKRAKERVPPLGALPKENSLSLLLLDTSKKGPFDKAEGIPEYAKRQKPNHAQPEVPAEIKRHALEKATNYLRADGELRESFGWLNVDLDQNKREEPAGLNGKKQFDQDRLEKILGAAYRFALVPKGSRGEEQAKSRIFTVPLAFAPLNTSVKINEQQSTHEFVRFLFEILQDLCTGGIMRNVELNEESPSADRAMVLARVRSGAMEKRGEIAGWLAEKYLAIVEDDEPGGELRDWQGYTPIGETKPVGDPESERALVEYVRALRERAMSESVNAPARRAVASILARDITRFWTAKAYGLHLFDGPKNEPNAIGTDRLYSVRISKNVERRSGLYPDVIKEPKKFVATFLSPPPLPNLPGLPEDRPDRAAELMRDEISTAIPELSSVFNEIKNLGEEEPVEGDLLERFRNIIRNDQGGESINSAFVDVDALLFERYQFLLANDKPYSAATWRLYRAFSGDGGIAVPPRERGYYIRRINHQILADLFSGLAPFSDLIDSDAFAFAKFISTGSGTRFIIDELDDRTYDNEFEILSQGAIGRLGEDVLEQTNQYDAPPTTEAPPDRLVDVTVQHHNPEWRQWKQQIDGSYLHTRNYFILPSRTLPTPPQPAKLDEARSSHSVQRLVPDMLPPGSVSDPFQYYKDQANGWFRDDIRCIEGFDAPLIKKTISHPVGTMGQSDGIYFTEADTADASKNWQGLEAFVTHFHFYVEPDEEKTDEDLLKGLMNDAFQISIEEYPRGEFRGGERSVASRVELGTEDLWKWYEYRRAIEKEGAEIGDIERPATMDVEKVWEDIDRLLEPGDKSGLLRNPEQVSHLRAVSQKTVRNYRMQLRKIEIDGDERYILKAQERPRDAGDGSDSNDVSDLRFMGTVIDARISRASQNQTNKCKGASDRLVLSFTVLGSSLFRYRARMRVVRNARDVDHDGDADMNPKFVLQSEYSPWVDFGAYTVRRDGALLLEAAQLPEPLRYLPSDLNAGMSLREWNAMADDEVARPQGAAAKTFGDPVGRLQKQTNTYWHMEELSKLVKTSMLRGTFLAYHPDRHPQFPVVSHARDRYLPLAATECAADKPEEFFHVQRGHVPTSSLALSLVWELAQNYKKESGTEETDARGNRDPFLVISNWHFLWEK